MPSRIESVQPLTSLQEPTKRISNEPNESNVSFANILKSALNKVNEAELEADVKTELLANGQIDQLHDVMISAQKASLTVETAVQIQQKVIDTYNEIMRMQI